MKYLFLGGDGTVSELFNGLVLRECRLKGIDANDISQTLPKPSKPIGIIPGKLTKHVMCFSNSYLIR